MQITKRYMTNPITYILPDRRQDKNKPPKKQYSQPLRRGKSVLTRILDIEA